MEEILNLENKELELNLEEDEETIEKNTIKYSIRIDNFEGPLDLLVYLIDQNKIDISEINIAMISNQYLDYLSQMKKLDLEIASEFLVMASDLIYLKSKKLLPQLEFDEEITEEELLLQILEYKRYKTVQEKFRERYNKYSKRIEKRPDQIALKNLVFDRKYRIDELVEAYEFSLEKKEYLYNPELDEKIETIGTKETFTVFSKVKEIFKTLKKNNKFVFNKIFSLSERSKNEVITAFISILELAKKDKITIKQSEIYGDILVEKKEKKVSNE